MPRSTTLYSLHLPIIVLLVAIFLSSGYLSYFATSTYQTSGTVLGKKDEKGNSAVAKKAMEDKGKGVGGMNAELHKQKITNVVTELGVVAKEEDELGNEEVSDEIDEVSKEQEEVVDEVSAAISQVESRPKWQTLLIGSDYKNLGKLRSALVHNRNAIRKLTKSVDAVSGEENDVVIDEQLAALYEEQDRIAFVIKSSEEEFSLLGWVVRFLTGYTPYGVEDEVEETTESTSPADTTP